MSKPYALLSDIHAHAWSAFATTLPTGVNSRLQIILDEMERAADELLAAGGDSLFIAGDLFHTRGLIDPEVFNPTVDTIQRILDRGVEVFAIPGNHDLKGKETTELGNAMQQLGKLKGFRVFTQPLCRVDPAIGTVLMVPWMSSIKDLKAQLAKNVANLKETIATTDLVIHAPINGVILGIPDHGFYPEELGALGFRNVFAGHYHNRVEFAGNVWSIGATTQQTWSDIATKAGFLLVYPDRVVERASHAPKFIEVTGDEDPGELALAVDGNYARVRTARALTGAEVAAIRDGLLGMGAAGVVVQAAKAAAVARTGSSVKRGASLEASVGAFIGDLKHPRQAELSAAAADVLARARAARSS
ncbi:hypothetical protein [Azospirillum argentinense]|uniref:metallophosphoesterase family protein n=1 Tax=Azospirillum argentinense TaxID=2970906 RepID=UPI0032DEFD8E